MEWNTTSGHAHWEIIEDTHRMKLKCISNNWGFMLSWFLWNVPGQKQHYDKHRPNENKGGAIQMPKKGEIYELESHPGQGLRLEKGGDYMGHAWYKVLRVPLAQAMKFTLPSGHYNGYQGDKKVRCLDVNNAYLDCAMGKYHEGNDLVAYAGHGGGNQNFHIGAGKRLFPAGHDNVKIGGNSHGSKLMKLENSDCYVFKLY